MNWLLRFYMVVKRPRNFLRLICTFIGTSMLLHWFRGYDVDWGGTNLTLSIEATIGNAVMLMVQEESARGQQKMLERIIALEEQLVERDERIEAKQDLILKVLTKGEIDEQL